MIAPLLLAASLGSTAAPGAPLSAGSRLAAVRARYRRLSDLASRPRALSPLTRAALDVRFQSARQSLDRLAAAPDETRLGDLERTEELDERIVPLLLRGSGAPLAAAPGAHVGLTRAGGAPVPFAYWVPAGYDPRRPAPLVVLMHGPGAPETDVVARRFLRELADASGAVVLAPGGDERTSDAMAAEMEAAEAALRPALALDPRRRYWGGLLRGVYGAFHAVARSAHPPAGVLAVAGMLDLTDAPAVERRLRGKGAYVVVGDHDELHGPEPIRAYVRLLRAAGVRARYYEVPGASHDLISTEPGIARAWSDMLAGVTAPQNDGLGR